MGWNNSSVWLKTALVCILLATILFVLGFATNNWMDSRYNTAVWGLWNVKWCTVRGCSSVNIRTIDLERMDMEVSFRFVQLFECVGLICVAIAFIVSLIAVFFTTVRKRVPLLCIIISSFVGVGAIVLGVVIFTTQMDHYDVAWSMGVAIAGAIFLFVGGIMGVIDLSR